MPDRGEQTIKYLGCYSNRARGTRKRGALPRQGSSPVEVPSPSRKAFRLSWAALLKRVFDLDLMTCRLCWYDVLRLPGGSLGGGSVGRGAAWAMSPCPVLGQDPRLQEDVARRVRRIVTGEPPDWARSSTKWVPPFASLCGACTGGGRTYALDRSGCPSLLHTGG